VISYSESNFIMRTRPASTTPLRARIRAEVRAGILDAAEEVFSEEGLLTGRMEHVAQRAGVAVGTVYNHFEDREAVLLRLLQARRGELLRHVDEAIAGAGPQFQDQLAAFLTSVFAYVRRHRPFLSLLVQEEAVALKLHLAPPPEERTLPQLRERAQRMVTLGLRQGRLRRRDSDLWPDLLIGSLHSLLLRELTLQSDVRLTDPGRQALAFFLEGAGRGSHA
jgi:AcrR family transcriptional regulator